MVGNSYEIPRQHLYSSKGKSDHLNLFAASFLHVFAKKAAHFYTLVIVQVSGTVSPPLLEKCVCVSAFPSKMSDIWRLVWESQKKHF